MGSAINAPDRIPPRATASSVRGPRRAERGCRSAAGTPYHRSCSRAHPGRIGAAGALRCSLSRAAAAGEAQGRPRGERGGVASLRAPLRAKLLRQGAPPGPPPSPRSGSSRLRAVGSPAPSSPIRPREATIMRPQASPRPTLQLCSHVASHEHTLLLGTAECS
ncbi:hypothetical protein NDU88_005969 [Pleurodeles waltl]|uniref:Uncharacterized protein n=1 Tax=Pleurodeles waltl TaxID=8319 RepID=A0AAV7QKF9_PLEWA|nr:hypothetical protein NDU88_005969 [Pleurodeles waltl]